jgi:hypothetical protein
VIVVATGVIHLGGNPGKALMGPGRNGDRSGIGIYTGVGQPVTFGQTVRLADGQHRSVTILSVEVTGLSGVSVVGIRANGANRGRNMATAERGVPVPGLDRDPLPLPGAVVPEGSGETRSWGVELAIGLRRDEPGAGHAGGFDVRYRIGRKTYRQHFPTGMTVCAYPGYVQTEPPPPRPPMECDTFVPKA